MVALYVLILSFLMMMVELILLLNIRVSNIMKQVLNLVVKEVYISNNIMIIKNDAFVLYMILD